jgi:Xaa-Pro aminopeptidase
MKGAAFMVDPAETLTASSQPATAQQVDSAQQIHETSQKPDSSQQRSATHEAEISNDSRSTLPTNTKFEQYMGDFWAPDTREVPEQAEVAPYARQRRQALSAQFLGQRLVIRAGTMKQRSNDTFYAFRAHSAFSHLTGWGSASEPGAVLVFEPSDSGHDITLFFKESADKSSSEFFANPEVGEFWTGPRPSLEQVSALLDIPTRSLDAFESTAADVTIDDPDLNRATSEMRLRKDDYEQREMQSAVDATQRGFNEIVGSLTSAVAERRGERLVEGVFHQRARLDGNWEGYETIAASGAHACSLHWMQNDGEVHENDLILIDAGIELDSLYTADITRTLPISGTFSAVQRKVYEAVLEAADAARAIVRPGIRFGDVHNTAMAVIERYTRQWGLLPDDGDPDVPYHKRYMVHGTSHHLGLDVHDCAAARREMYFDGIVEEGMVFTIEPGLYFHEGDLTVPEEMRGIGVRIEDDILVTPDGCVNLSSDIPRTVEDVEAWVQAGRGSQRAQ